MKKNILIILLSLIDISFFAQVENIPLITVYGESVIKVKPDYVILGLKISKEISLNSNGEVRAIFEIFSKEDSRVKLFDFDGKNILESVIQVDNSKFSKEIFINIMDLDKLDKYLLELYKLGYRDYVFLDYRISNLQECKNQSRKEAIKYATKKATLLANELGQSIGKAHTLEEIGCEEYNWYNIHNEKELENITFKLGADNYLIEPGYITITSKVKVSFDLLK